MTGMRIDKTDTITIEVVSGIFSPIFLDVNPPNICVQT